MTSKLKASRLVLFLFLGLFFQDLGAQEVTVSFRLLGWELSQESVWYNGPDGYREISIRSFGIGESLPLAGRRLVLYRQEPQTETGGEPSYVEIGSGRLPSGSDQALFLVFPRNDGVVELAAVDTSWSRFPEQSLLLINCSPNALAFRVAEERFTLAPLGSKVASDDAARRQVPLQIGTVVQGRPVIGYQAMIRTRPRQRQIICVFDPSRSGPRDNGEQLSGILRTLTFVDKSH